jgi:hypothetical protein
MSKELLNEWRLIVIYETVTKGNAAEFCEGICFHNAGPHVLKLTFQHADPTPFINPPGTLAE